MEASDDRRDVDSCPLGDDHLGEEHGSGKDDAVEEEGDDVVDDLADEEEAVEDVHLLPECNFLQ